MTAKTPTIPMQAIDGSSLVAATGHDPETNVMHIQFHDGSVHAYTDVPATVHDNLRAGGELGSVGKTFHREIKGAFPTSPVVAEADESAEG